mmetsp:Transcript_32755/g.29037  ORF Transcript_32755/g.29037 Transcript_32755/m.29037 type:complete len:121 (+) Transcript_32755:24-386(+)
MTTYGRNTVISLNYKEKETEIYYIPETYDELIQDILKLFDSIANLSNYQNKFRIFYYDFDSDKVNIKNDYDFQSALKYCDKNGIYSLKLYLNPSNNETSSDEESEMMPEEEAIPNHVPEQ